MKDDQFDHMQYPLSVEYLGSHFFAAVRKLIAGSLQGITRTCLEALSNDNRKRFQVMRITYNEIALESGRSPSSVKRAVARAMAGIDMLSEKSNVELNND
jgi:hypothetical protein